MQHAFKVVQLTFTWNLDEAGLNLTLIRCLAEIVILQCKSLYYLHLELFASLLSLRLSQLPSVLVSLKSATKCTSIT